MASEPDEAGRVDRRIVASESGREARVDRAFDPCERDAILPMENLRKIAGLECPIADVPKGNR